MYYLFSTRLSAWMFANGTYGSDIKQAKKFEADEMLALCKRHYEAHDETYGLVPVRVGTLAEIAA